MGGGAVALAGAGPGLPVPGPGPGGAPGEGPMSRRARGRDRLRPRVVPGLGLGRVPAAEAVHEPAGVGEVGLRARCRDFSWSSPASPLPHPACASPRTGRSACLAPWSVMCFGGCPCRSRPGRYFAAAIAVADHGDAGCAGEYDPVPGEPPPLVTETAAEF